MYPLRSNEEFCFTEIEKGEMKSIASELVDGLRKKNLTYIQAVEVLEICKVNLKMLSLS